MGTIHSQTVVVKLATNDVSTYVNTHTYEPTATVHQTTGYGASWDANKGGLKKGTFSFGGIYDDTATAPPKLTRSLIGTSFAVTYGPEGSVAGKPKITFNAILNKYNETAKVDDMVSWSVDMTLDGAAAEGVFP